MKHETRNVVYLSLGSNLGDREANLRAAITRIRTLGDVTAVSSLYETEPVDFLDQPWFLNCVILLETGLSPRPLLDRLLAVERDMGRQRLQPKGPRLIDIDVLLYGDEIISEPSLTVPHPGMHERRFVLEPLVEIAPDVRHPLFQKSAADLLATLPPAGQSVRRL